MDFPIHHRPLVTGAPRVLETPFVQNGAGLLVECLYRHGVRHVFGMPGSHSTYLWDAIYQHGDMQTILCRNEQAGAFMADGYARSTGRPGVICTTAGPGATNALTGIAEAFSDSVPVLLIAAQVNHDRIHESCGRYHEIDLEGIFRPCVRFAGTVMKNDQIPAMIDAAFEAMIATRPGPAALLLPQDLMALPAETPPSASPSKVHRLTPSSERIRQAVEEIRRSQRPVVLAGGGVAWSDASEEVAKLALRLNCPVVTTLNGKGVLDERSPFSLGHGRTRRARMALMRADLLIAIGCRFTEMFTASGSVPIPERLIQIDVDPEQIGTNFPVDLALVGDARSTLQAILAELPPQDTAWQQVWQRGRSAPQLKSEWLIDTLRAELPEGSVVFADSSEMGLRMQTDFLAYGPRTFFYPSNYATLGWGFPASLGGAFAATDRSTVCVCGDGGFLMSVQELATAARYHLRVITVVHNDSTYGAIKLLQRNQHDRRYADTDLNNPDFVKLGKSFGIPSCAVGNSQDFTMALQQAFRCEGPSLIEIREEWRSLRL